MHHNDIRTLKILEKIENGESASQRYLARELNVSLGLVNSFIKRLAGKGYFKITTIPRNRVKYILTPKGIAEKSRLTYEYIRYSYQIYSGTRQRLCALFADLEKQGCCRIVLYGANDFAEIAYISCHGTNIEIVAIVDDQKMGLQFLHREVKSPSILRSLVFDKILVAILDKSQSILPQIVETGIPREKIISFEPT